eukprot:TRINITY_DN1192_c0_g1_i1.p1 TRINITY_DN1192_c0_g1~~TRINITY_DN1192_c0_g1_i1.p1  ORF type:complete len:184 (+),score=62.15 TRINITY_DN1192_c0_g1_i1:538-1089(+)
MIVVASPDETLPSETEYPHGLTPPLRDVRRRRFRREPDLNPEIVQSVEKDLISILAGGTAKDVDVEVVEHEEEADDEENDDADHDHPPPSQPIALPKKKTWKKKAKDGASDGGGPQGKAGATSKGKENVTKGTKGVGKGNGVGGSGKGKNAALGGVGGGKAAAKPRASPLKRKQEEVDEEDEY